MFVSVSFFLIRGFLLLMDSPSFISLIFAAARTGGTKRHGL